MEAKLSVIVPIYNVEKYLRQCVESILNQSMREIEVILVDDGSTDSSGAICDEYAQKDQRIKVFHQENEGPFAARRRGVFESSCNYVTFVDGDDFVAPNSFILAECAMENGVDIIVFGVIRFYSKQDQRKEEQSVPAGIYHKSEIEKNIWPKMIWSDEKKTNGMFNALYNRVINKNLIMFVYQTYRCDDIIDIYYGDDVAIVLPLYKHANTVEMKDECYYYYRQREIGEIPGYITDPNFFDKAYRLYCYLRDVFQDDNRFTRPLESYYMKNVCLRKRIYRDGDNVRYIFPFDKVERGSIIVLYGAGAVGQTYMAQLKKLNYCKVVLWVDKNYKNYEINEVSPVERIKAVSFDKIVIAIQNEETKNSVEFNLISMGVDRGQIVK